MINYFIEYNDYVHTDIKHEPSVAFYCIVFWPGAYRIKFKQLIARKFPHDIIFLFNVSGDFYKGSIRFNSWHTSIHKII